MALRALIEDGSTRIRETTLAEHNAMLSRITYLYQQGTVPIELSVVSSGGNITPNMTDTRYKSGTAARNTSLPWPVVTKYPTESDTGEPELVTGITYDKISQTISSVPQFHSGNYHALGIKPVYRADDNTIQEMTLAQVLTYFINPIVSAMQSTVNAAAPAGGSYYISTSTSISGSTNLGLVFSDTTANLAGYTAAGIGVAGTYQDVYNQTDYYLYRVDSNYASQAKFGPLGYRTPLVIDYGQSTYSRASQTPSGLRHMTYAEFDSLFSPIIKWAVYGEAGYRVRYNINGAGTRQGTQMANRQMLGISVTGQFTTHPYDGDDYRAQEFPNGTIVVESAWDLNLERS